MATDPYAATLDFQPPAAAGANTLSLAGAAPRPAAPPPVVLPGFRIESELGRGGMGVVYLATQEGLNRQVALKMVLSGVHASESEKGRFLAEAEAVAAVRHPGVVQVFDFGTHDGRPFFALEFLPGGSLAGKLNGTPLSPNDGAKLVEQIARAVQAAHDAGVIHRDLKPGNILFDADGTPKVTDFGLARRSDTNSGLTQTGAILGTPSYMAPEQAAGAKDVGPPADIYAVGAVLYECLTGRPPFRAATPIETIHQVLNSEPLPPSRLVPSVPRDLETIALKCLSKDAARRYATAAAVADDLTRYRNGEPILARPVSAVERGWRWVRRNPILAAAIAVVAVGLPLTTLVVLVSLLQVARANVKLAAEKQEAENQRQIAHARLEKAVAAVDRMVMRVNGERWASDPALQDERRQVLEEAVAFFNGFTGEDSADPLVRKEAAKAHTRVSGAYLMLGESGKSGAAAAEAGRLYDGLMAEFPDDADHPAAASEVHSLAGNAAALQARYPDALREYTRAVELADQARQLDPSSAPFKERAVEARSSLAFFYLQADRSKGQQLLPTMLDLARQIGEPAGAPYRHRVAYAFALTVAAPYDMGDNKFADAAAKYTTARNVLDALAGQPAPSARTAELYLNSRAAVAVQLGHLSSLRATTPAQRREAAAQMRAGLDLFDTLLRTSPKAFPYRLQKFHTLRGLSDIYRRLNDAAAVNEVNAAADRLIGEMIRENPHLEWLKAIDVVRQTTMLIDRVRADDRLDFEESAAELLRIATPQAKPGVMYNIACLYAVAAAKRPAEAEAYAAKAVAILNELVGTDYFRVPQRVPHLDKDTDLDALRGRADYKAFREAAGKLPPMTPPAR